MRALAIEALRHKYEAQKKSAEYVFKNYIKNPVAIGEHPDLLEEMDKAVTRWDEANSKLQALYDIDSD